MAAASSHFNEMPSSAHPPELLTKARLAIEAWKSNLLDLSGKNRLLRFREYKLSTVPIETPELPTLFDWLVLRDRPVPVVTAHSIQEVTEQPELPLNQADIIAPSRGMPPTHALLTSKDPDQLQNSLYNLRQRARASIEERGVNVLYAALGFLLWSDPQEKSEHWRAPLILAPVTIDRPKADRYTVAPLEEDVVLNPTLLHKLDHDFGLKLPELTNELETLDIEDYLSRIQSAVASLPNITNVTVQSQAFLGLFDFLKIPMYQDLVRHAGSFLSHPIIGGLAGLPAPESEQSVTAIPADELDEHMDPRSTFQVLDADSSQQEALLYARSGKHMVIQGPPGTGKSQTIANLIAESLATGKRVLFVSEKAAALEVVKRRLDECSLGDACLELHSHKIDKKKILGELERTLNAPRPAAPGQVEATLEELMRVRDELNAYVRALHQPRFAWKQTAYRVHGLLASLKHTPPINFPVPGVTEMTESVMRRRQARLEALVSHARVISQLPTHPWKGLKARPPSLAFSSELRGRFEKLHRLAEEIERRIPELHAATGLAWPEELSRLEVLVRLFGKYRLEVLGLPAAVWRRRFEQSYSRWTRFLQPRYYRDRNALRAYCRTGWNGAPPVVADDLRRLETALEWLAVPPGTGAEDSSARPQIEDLDRLLTQTLGELASIRNEFEPDSVNTAGLERRATTLKAWCEKCLQSLERLDEYLAYLRDRNLAIQDGLGEFLEAALSSDVPVEYWAGAYRRKVYETWLDEAGHSAAELGYFSGPVHEKRIEQFRRLDVEQRMLARRRVAARVAANRPPPPTELVGHAVSAEINILAREFHKKRRIKPMRKLFREAPQVIQALKPCFMMSPLMVSQYLEPDRFHFDLVIFDEASQVKVEDAIGCIFRGRQLVVAGDSKQLPPTRFFDVVTTDEDWDEKSEDETDVYESILDALAAMPGALLSRMLRWHYRSRGGEELIKFSNENFYGNNLYTFPHPGQAGAERALDFVFVPDGIYERGGNRKNMVEARRVVELIFEHVEKHSDWSLAVVTFSEAQKSAIEHELDRQKQGRPDLEEFFKEDKEAPFRVKNLELIQGDERDAIIFSIGYGRDEAGKLVLNFGPLNQAGGLRRLNVAVTRARHHVTVVSSIRPDDPAWSRSDNKGVKLLREYMLLARDGLKALYGAPTTGGDTGEIESPLEGAVYERLTAEGLELHSQVGCSGYRIDLAVVDPKTPGRYCLGIECDGATYHSAKTARDRDRLRQSVLEGLGWRIHRIWSREWNANPQREVKKILDLVEQYAGQYSIEPKSEPGNAVAAALAESGLQTLEMRVPAGRILHLTRASALPEGAAHYSRYEGSFRSSEPYLRSPGIIADDIVRLVEFEGPIHVNAIIRTLRQNWGVGRAGRRIRKAIQDGLRVAERDKRVTLSSERNFVWPKNSQPVRVRIPYKDDSPRPLKEICPEEIREAIRVCLKQAGGGASKADVVGLVIRLFGHQKATNNAAEPVYSVLEKMLLNGDLIIVEGIVRASNGVSGLGPA